MDPVTNQAEVSADEESIVSATETETDAEQDAAESERETGDSEEQGEKQEKPKLPNRVRKHISKLTRQKYELLESNNELRSRLEAIEKRLPPAQAEKKEPVAVRPKVEDFASYDDYVDAVADWKAEQKVTAALQAQRERETKETDQARTQEIYREYNQRVTEARERYDDFDEVLGVDFSAEPGQEKTFQSVVMTIYELENGPDVAYWLAKHTEERDKVLAMTPQRAAAQLGRISDKIAQETPSEETDDSEATEEVEESESRAPEKKTAPRPIKPVKKATPSSSGLDDELPYDEWLARRRKQLAKS